MSKLICTDLEWTIADIINERIKLEDIDMIYDDSIIANNPAKYDELAERIDWAYPRPLDISSREKYNEMVRNIIDKLTKENRIIEVNYDSNLIEEPYEYTSYISTNRCYQDTSDIHQPLYGILHKYGNVFCTLPSTRNGLDTGRKRVFNSKEELIAEMLQYGGSLNNHFETPDAIQAKLLFPEYSEIIDEILKEKKQLCYSLQQTSIPSDYKILPGMSSKEILSLIEKGKTETTKSTFTERPSSLPYTDERIAEGFSAIEHNISQELTVEDKTQNKE